ncbi:hypothetical protein MKX01_017119 [Papaver californicum]|nr:hypothetical protein MKX01_017119 [Papaver californicum]
MMKLRSKRFFRSNSKLNRSVSNVSRGSSSSSGGANNFGDGGEMKWELRPGGMLVQKRENGGNSSSGGALITVRVATESRWHDISIDSTSSFGELKIILSLVTGLEPKEQRVLFKGKEREDGDYLHMVGVRDKDKVLLLQDPAIKERKKLLHHANLLARNNNQVTLPKNRTISV